MEDLVRPEEGNHDSIEGVFNDREEFAAASMTAECPVEIRFLMCISQPKTGSAAEGWSRAAE